MSEKHKTVVLFKSDDKGLPYCYSLMTLIDIQGNRLTFSGSGIFYQYKVSDSDLDSFVLNKQYKFTYNVPGI